jgi:putative colanic acid biosynthesis UDP-glucose lipid carrier transferase
MKPQIHYVPTLAERYPVAFVAGVVDFLLIVAGSYAGHYLRFGYWDMFEHYFAATLVIAGVVVMCQLLLGTYLSWRGRHLIQQLSRMYTGWLLALAVIASIAVLLKVAEDYSRLWLGSSLVISIALVTAFRVSVYLFLRNLRAQGKNLKRVLVVDSGDASHMLRGMTWSSSCAWVVAPNGSSSSLHRLPPAARTSSGFACLSTRAKPSRT